VLIFYLISVPGGSGGAEEARAARAVPYAEQGVQVDVVTLTGRDVRAPIITAAGGVEPRERCPRS
jgi:hypothetical protein